MGSIPKIYLFIYLEHKGTLKIHQEYVGNMPRDTLMDIEKNKILGDDWDLE